MAILGRVSALAIIGLFLINVVLGLIAGGMSHHNSTGDVRAGEIFRPPASRSRSVNTDIGSALSADVQFFADRVLIDVEGKSISLSPKGLRFDFLITPRPVEGAATLHMDRLAVDGAGTALVTEDGSWFLLKDTLGIGWIRDGAIWRSSPVFVIGVPRRVTLVFHTPLLPGRGTLLVRWAPGRSAGYAQAWRVNRITEVNLPGEP